MKNGKKTLGILNRSQICDHKRNFFILNKRIQALMKTIIIELDDKTYNEIEEMAKKEGYKLVSEYAKAVLLSKQGQMPSDIISQIMPKLERKMQDLINPFTSQIADLKKKYAEIIEKIEEIQSKNEGKPKIEEKPGEEEERMEAENRKRGRKSAIEILEEQGVVFESELKLRNKDAFFGKLEREGAKVLHLESERIALSKKFYEEFIEKLKQINTTDPEEAVSKMNQKQAKLFMKLVADATAIFDGDKKYWRLIVD